MADLDNLKNDIDDLKLDVEKIRDEFEGDDGLRVRLKLLEKGMEDVKSGMAEIKAKLESMGRWQWPDARTVVAIVSGILALGGVGGAAALRNLDPGDPPPQITTSAPPSPSPSHVQP